MQIIAALNINAFVDAVDFDPSGVSSYGNYIGNYSKNSKALNTKLRVKAVADDEATANKIAQHAKNAGVTVISVAQQGTKFILELGAAAAALIALLAVLEKAKGIKFIGGAIEKLTKLMSRHNGVTASQEIQANYLTDLAKKGAGAAKVGFNRALDKAKENNYDLVKKVGAGALGAGMIAGVAHAAKKNEDLVNYYNHPNKAYVGRLLNMSKSQLEAEYNKTHDDSIKAIISHIVTERR